MSQRFSLYLDLHVQDNLEFFGGIYGVRGKGLRAAIDEVVERTALSEYRHSLTSALPGGIRQRLALAAPITAQAPRSSSSTSPPPAWTRSRAATSGALIRDAAAAGTTIFVTTHYMDEAEYCARIGLMVDGALVALDAPDALKRKYVPGTTVAFEGPDMRRVLSMARDLPYVRAADLFGTSLHVRFDERGTSAEAIEQKLREHGVPPTRRAAVEASLEDVFLAVVGGFEKPGAAA